MASRIQQVHSLDALLAPFTREVNARCFSRTLTGDFEAVARQLATDGVLEVDAELLQSAPGLDAAAVRVLLDDLAWLTSLGREPQLNVITHYPKDTRGLPITVDVHSFHVDSAPVEADTFLCTYAGACSEGLENEAALRLIDEPTVQAALRAQGLEAEAHHFDLHFAAAPGAQPFSFGVGSLWRLAVDWPGSPSLPCIHRAPAWDGRPRLLLIS
ncbi:MAG: hypothetical protein U0228_16810 [Myxococcaceae bacterium]